MEHSKFITGKSSQKSGDPPQESGIPSQHSGMSSLKSDKKFQKLTGLSSIHSSDTTKTKEEKQDGKLKRKAETQSTPPCDAGALEMVEKMLCLRLLNAAKSLRQDHAFLKKVSTSLTKDAQVFCRALFLSKYTRTHVCEEDIKIIADIIMQHIDAKNDVELKHITMSSLPFTITDIVTDIMKTHLEIESSRISDVDVFDLYCSVVKNIVNQCGYMNSETGTMEWSSLCNVPSVVWCIVDFFDYLRTSLNIEIQDLFSSEKVYCELNDNMLLQFTKIEKCLAVLEHVLRNSLWVKAILEYKNCQLMSTINGVFGFCLDNLFQNRALMKQGKITESLLNCTVTFIKMLNSLTTVTCDKSFSSKSGINKFSIFLSQRMLICFFEFNVRNWGNKFRMEIVCLEILFVIIHAMWITKEQFVEIMTMNIQVGNCQNTSLHFLIKSLLASLEEIKALEVGAIKASATGNVEPSVYSILHTPVPMEEVEHFGAAHLEATTLAAYLVIIVGLFAEINESTHEKIFNAIPDNYVGICVDIVKKFREFLVLINNENPIAENFIERALKIFEVRV